MIRARVFRLPGGAYAPAAARNAVAGFAGSLRGRGDDLRLLVTELVTNGVTHADAGLGGSLGLLVRASERGIRVEVSDPGEGFDPAGVGPSADMTSGWGLYLVDALADRWGVTRGGETRVWFELLAPAPRGVPVGPRHPAPVSRRQVSSGGAAATRLAGAADAQGSQSTERQSRVDEAVVRDWLRRLAGR